METVDTLTDVVGRPVPVCFQSLRGHHKVRALKRLYLLVEWA